MTVPSESGSTDSAAAGQYPRWKIFREQAKMITSLLPSIYRFTSRCAPFERGPFPYRCPSASLLCLLRLHARAGRVTSFLVCPKAQVLATVHCASGTSHGARIFLGRVLCCALLLAQQLFRRTLTVSAWWSPSYAISIARTEPWAPAVLAANFSTDLSRDLCIRAKDMGHLMEETQFFRMP